MLRNNFCVISHARNGDQILVLQFYLCHLNAQHLSFSLDFAAKRVRYKCISIWSIEIKFHFADRMHWWSGQAVCTFAIANALATWPVCHLFIMPDLSVNLKSIILHIVCICCGIRSNTIKTASCGRGSISTKCSDVYSFFFCCCCCCLH